RSERADERDEAAQEHRSAAATSKEPLRVGQLALVPGKDWQREDAGAIAVADLETGAVAEDRGGDDQRDHGSKVYVVPAGVDPAEDRGGFAGQHEPNEEG